MTNRLLVALTGLALLGMLDVARAASVSPAHPDLRYVGRWDDSNPVQPWAQAQGSTLLMGFTGTSVAATLDASGGEYFRVILDGDADSSTKVSFPSGVPLSLASGLAPGPHSLQLVKETDVARATLLGITIDDGESLVPAPPAPDRRITFYGDSNLAGYSLESERNLGSSQLVGCHYGYAGITARMFGAEYQNISRSGATIQSLNASYGRIDWNTSTPTWDFASHPVDVVVVNIGANNTFSPKALNKQRYHDLLDDLRAAQPLAHIMLYNSYGWDTDEPAGYIHEVIAERADPAMSWAVFPWVFEQYHGCQTEHAGMAQILAAHLESVTGWSAGPSDVVSGYGQGGDLANGSFEQAAPFGGWGWRYFDDPGVSRVFDPAGAQHGEHYLRLQDGASSHQTNPASDGQVVAVSMWLRAASAGDSVDVSISFRDQDGGGEPNAPLTQTTQSFTLSTSWERHALMVTAPLSPANPVYSARVTFTAGAGDSIDIDRVRADPWEDLGGGTPGSAGIPTLVGEGTLAGETPFGFSLANAPPGAAMLLWISFASTPFMALGGTVHAVPFAIQLPVTADASGGLDISAAWPDGIPHGTPVWFQYLVQDTSVIPGITLSNGLLATTP